MCTVKDRIARYFVDPVDLDTFRKPLVESLATLDMGMFCVIATGLYVEFGRRFDSESTSSENRWMIA